MRLTIPQTQLLKTLQVVERAVNDRSTLPILANVLLQTEKEALTLTATDLDVGIQCRYTLSQPAEPGTVTLPARRFTTIVRELPDDVVTLEAKKNQTATISCGNSSFRLPGLPAEDFPAMPAMEPREGCALPQGALKTLLTKTAYAMSMEETRFILNGALFAAQKNALVVVATDGRRLATAHAPTTGPVKEPLEAVIPAKTIKELSRLLHDEGDPVAIAALRDNQLQFRFGETTVTTRLVEGQFPQYEKVIPPPSKQRFSANRQQLLNAVRRTSLMTTATSQAVTFELGADRLTISKESPEVGSAREELPVSYRGQPMTVAFNPEFWLDALRALEGEDVTIEVAGADRPAAVRESEFTYIVLPMKLA